MIIVLARAQAKSEHADALADVVARTAQASRPDDGCLDYHFYRDVEDGTRFISVEQWESKAHLDAHMNNPAVQELFRVLPDMVSGPPEITVHEVSSSAPYS